MSNSQPTEESNRHLPPIDPAAFERIISTTIDRVTRAIQEGLTTHDLHVGQRDAERDSKMTLELKLVRGELKELEKIVHDGRNATREELRDLRGRMGLVRRDQKRMAKVVDPDDGERGLIPRLQKIESRQDIEEVRANGVEKRVGGFERWLIGLASSGAFVVLAGLLAYWLDRLGVQRK